MVQRIEELEQQGAELLSTHQQVLERINITSKNSHPHPQVTHPDLGRNQPRKKVVKSGEVNPVMRVKVGTYIQKQQKPPIYQGRLLLFDI
jgi:hypothetical protein